MERRKLLQLAAQKRRPRRSTRPLDPETVRRQLALLFDSEPHDLDEWHMVLSDHLHAIRTRSPARARDDLLIDLAPAQRQLRSAAADDETELQRVMAGLAILLANALTRLGDHSNAIIWWRTAYTAADAAGDLDLRLLALGSEAGFGLYGQRPPATVLALTRVAQEITGDRPSIGRAKVETAEAKALSLLGRHDEARQKLHTLSQSDPGSSSEGLIPGYWTGTEIYFAESWVYAHAGDEAAADEARTNVLTTGWQLDYQYATNVRLHEALCTVVNGGIDRGAEQAAEILMELPSAHQSHMITETGRAVLHAVPREQRNRPAVRDLHTAIATQALHTRHAAQKTEPTSFI
ncbi:hypothetical protein AGRA3207_003156 [Actinomadura graeca]|uniref:XRE family transcriptional regulator n=1 Tax=Actinomadura graeca TaxID=2750812 RepID=A0ABX8QW35_9ACTN|nr:hypothetical protein [Actinomadura graeca]QXJ22194.1 hypothetical protein AGRA3207_003156 [Actinomadura graeca]